MSTESLLWALVFYAYLSAGFVMFIAGKEIGRKIRKKDGDTDG